MSVTTFLHALVTARVDARPLGVVRMMIGLAALLKIFDAGPVLARLGSGDVMRLPYVAWAPQPSPALHAALLAVWAMAAVALAIGWRTRTAGAALIAVLTTVIVLDEQTYSSHLYLLALLVALLVIGNSGAALSLDARGRSGGMPPLLAAWPVTLLKLQVSIVYGFAALAKLNPEYLSGVALANFIPFNAAAELIGMRPMIMIVITASIFSIAMELALAIWLWVPSRRHVALALGVAIHLGMIATIRGGVRLQLVVFALEMWSLYLLFFSPAELHAIGRRITNLLPGRLRPRFADQATAG